MVEVEHRDRLDEFREQLMRFARSHVPERLQAKIDASDIVQQAMLNAHARRERFSGNTDAELAGCLRRILANTIVDANRTFTGKRDVTLERSLDAAVVDRSSFTGIDDVAGNQSTPSAGAIRNEEERQLVNALSALPTDQRTALELHL